MWQDVWETEIQKNTQQGNLVIRSKAEQRLCDRRTFVKGILSGLSNQERFLMSLKNQAATDLNFSCELIMKSLPTKTDM